MKKSAFTMIELIIVIVVAGILAAVMLPRLERDVLREGANQVVRHIQYTQHLAMVNDVYDATNTNWELAYWHISFRADPKKCYLVASDANTNAGIAQAEAALDPLTQQFLYSDVSCTDNSDNNNDLFLNTKYGISTVDVSDGCGSPTNSYIAFDNLGRPLQTKDVNDPVTTADDCTVTLSTATGTAVIKIEAETGYTRITSITD